MAVVNVLQDYRTPYPDTTGGVDVVVANLLRAPTTQYRSALLYTVASRAQNGSHIAADGVVVHRLCLPLPTPGLGRIAFLRHVPAAWRALRQTIVDSAIDVVHLHTLQHYHLYFVLLRWLGGPPYVITLHRAEVLAYATRGALTRWVWRRSLRNAAAVVAVAQWLARLAQRTLPTTASINFIDNAIAPPATVPDGAGLRARLALPPRYCIMVGTCQAYKGHATAIKAWAQLPPAQADLGLVLIGTGALLPHYRALAEELGITHRLYLTGQLPNAEVFALIRDSVAFVMPSRSEGLSIALLEAGLAGVPVICTDIEPFRELVEAERTALLFGVDDDAGLAQALRRLLDDDALRTHLGCALADHVRTHYTVERMREQYRAVYDQARTHA